MRTNGELHQESRIIRRVGRLEYFAENGVITVHDTKDGSTQRIRAEVWEERAKAMGRSYARATTEAQRAAIAKTSNEMLECCKEARDQGDPFSPEVQEWNRKHKPWKNKRSMTMPKGFTIAGQSPSGIILAN